MRPPAGRRRRAPIISAASGSSVRMWSRIDHPTILRVANALLTVAQIVGGILSGTLALIADALHNFSDMASLVIASAARKIARRPADERMTIGYGRIEIVAALINYTTLILVGFDLIYEGGMRMIDPTQGAG